MIGHVVLVFDVAAIVLEVSRPNSLAFCWHFDSDVMMDGLKKRKKKKRIFHF
jgi:uncharacterized protein YndB with AHSA1/START domain